MNIVLTEEQAKDMLGIFESAEEGRADFEYLVSQEREDYSPEDIQENRARHARQSALETEITRQIRSATAKYIIRKYDPQRYEVYDETPYSYLIEIQGIRTRVMKEDCHEVTAEKEGEQ